MTHSSSETTRVAICGVGAVSPLGANLDESFKRLIAGESGIDEITRIDTQDLSVHIAGEANDFDPRDFMDARVVRRSDRFCQMAVASAVMAANEAGISTFDPERTGVIIGTGIGGMETFCSQYETFERRGPGKLSPLGVPLLMSNAAAGAIAMHFSITGPSFAVVSACAAGAHALGEAMRLIRSGVCDTVIAGGSEASITRFTVASFASMGALSKRNETPTLASRPFDKDRDGFVLGEGAAVMILRRFTDAEGSRLAELAGYGASSDAFHITQPDPDGKGAVAAMRRALVDAEMSPTDVEYINAHGTSTPFNDRIESLAIETVFGAHQPAVSSTKGATGHLLGAAGALEAAFCVRAIADGVLPPSLNVDTPDCNLNLVANKARDAKLNIALSNSFGFGGHNASLVIASA